MPAKKVTLYVAPSGYVYHRDRECYQLKRADTRASIRVDPELVGGKIEHATHGTRHACQLCAR